MTFQEWFNSAPHRAKYTSDHPAYLAAQEAWEAAHEACAKVVDSAASDDKDWDTNDWNQAVQFCASRVRAREKT